MNTQEIESFIKYQMERGTPRAEIERVLKLNQVKPEEIAQVFASLGPAAATPPTGGPPPSPTPPAPAQPTPATTPPPPPPPRPNPIPPPPTPPTPPPASVPTPPVAATAGGHQWLGAIVLVLILVLIGGAAAYAYFLKPEWWQNIFNRPPDPAVVLAQMNENLKQVKALEYDLSLTGTNQTTQDEGFGTQNQGTLNIQVTGAGDWVEKDRPKSSNRVTVSTSYGGTTYNLALEIRSDGETAFLKFDQIPTLPFADLSFITNRWIALPLNSASSSSALGFSSNPELAAELRGLALVHNPLILTWVGREKDETSGQTQNHFQINLDPVKVGNLMAEIGRVAAEQSAEALAALSSSSTLALPVAVPPAPTPAEIQTMLDAFQNVSADLWLDTVKHLPKRTELKFELVNQDPSLDKFAGTMRLDIKSYDQPVNVVAPFETISIQELIGEIFGNFFSAPPEGWPGLNVGSSTTDLVLPPGAVIAEPDLGTLLGLWLTESGTNRQRVEDASIQANLSSLRSEAELWFDSKTQSFAGLCESPGVTQLLAKLPQGIQTSCNVSSDNKAYAVDAMLMGGGFFCVDSLGTAKKTTDALAPNATACDK